MRSAAISIFFSIGVCCSARRKRADFSLSGAPKGCVAPAVVLTQRERLNENDDPSRRELKG